MSIRSSHRFERSRCCCRLRNSWVVGYMTWRNYAVQLQCLIIYGKERIWIRKKAWCFLVVRRRVDRAFPIFKSISWQCPQSIRMKSIAATNPSSTMQVQPIWMESISAPIHLENSLRLIWNRSSASESLGEQATKQQLDASRMIGLPRFYITTTVVCERRCVPKLKRTSKRMIYMVLRVCLEYQQYKL